MSQQINLLNSRLRVKRDALSLPLLVAVALFLVIALAATSLYSFRQRQALMKEEASLLKEYKNMTDQVKALGDVVASRKPNPELLRQATALKEMLQPREEVLLRLQKLSLEEGGFSPYFQGFSRQALEGVWLTEFVIGRANISIRGRLTDPALLPAYIRRLNSEKNFQGRNFSTLDMLAVEPKTREAIGTTAKTPVLARPLPPYTEFALQSKISVPTQKPPPGGK